MNNDRPGPDTDSGAARGTATPSTRPSATKGTLREVGDVIVAVWWRFFDWLAVVSWKKLALVSILGLILTAMVSSVGTVGHRVGGAPNFFLLLIVASIIIKVVAGGKRRAEQTANEPTQRAETEQLHAPWSKRAWKRCRPRSSRTSCSTRWRASTSSSRPTRHVRPGCSKA